ncbi:MAG: TonB-dependent receptor plug domain-containing protein [Rikenellaceae bacterium]|jgi:TonB-dependent SusC/RagA subfamily outer membrane receptor|nr:TonB-dependent receptor plug domain-containing protein [Rikenellaceae bacterium]
MNKIRFFAMLLLLGVLASGATAQRRAKAQDESAQSRDFSVRIINRRGRPVASVVMQSLSTGEVGITGDDGRYLFSAIAPKEDIRLFLDERGEMVVPVEGIDSLLVVLRSNQQVEYLDAATKQQIELGYGTIPVVDNLRPANELDVVEVLRTGSYTSLLELMRGRFAGVEIKRDGSVIVRGNNSLFTSVEPLVVIDGVGQMGTLADVDGYINVQDIQKITVLKDGSMYGSRGANGVIIITTRKP